MEQLMRSMLLRASRNRLANRLAKRYGLRLGAERFVAGDTIDRALVTVRELQAEGLSATLDHLGEFVRDVEEAHESADDCLEALQAIAVAGVDATLSVKLTQLGLDIDTHVAELNMRRILEVARKTGVRVTIDMEDYGHCAQTLDLFEQLNAEYDNVGTVIQAYLYRSFEDVLRLSEKRVHLRIVKGAYKESAEVAYPDKADVDRNYVKLVEVQLLSGGFTAVATHDERIVEHVKRFVAQHRIERSSFEFQMLYGIRMNLQLALVAQGYPVRVYVPYGKDWYGYFMRRLAERPANLGFVVKNMWR